MSKTFPAFFQKVSCRFVKIPFYLSIRKVWGIFFRILLQLFIDLGHWASIFQPFSAFFNGVVNTAFVEPREHLDELLWIENGLLIQLWTCAENFLAYYKKFTIGLSKLYYTCPEDQTGKKNSYLFVSYRFRTLRETCLAFSQSLFSITLKFEFYMSIQTIQTFSNEETSLGKKYVYNIFLEHWAIHFRLSSKEFPGALWKCHSTSP